MRFRSSIVGVALACLMAVAGCAALGLEQPKGFDQSLAEAYGVYTGVENAAAAALGAGSITSGDAAQVRVLAVQARILLDGAKTAESAGDASTAAGKLALATNVLAQVQTYLTNRGRPK